MDWIVLLPPVVAIALALWTRQIYLSLFAGLWLGTTILVGGNPVAGLRELAGQVVAVFDSESNASILMFCLLVGSLIALVQASGGVQGFIDWARRHPDHVDRGGYDGVRRPGGGAGAGGAQVNAAGQRGPRRRHQ